MIAQSILISYHTEAFVKTEVGCTVLGARRACQNKLEIFLIDGCIFIVIIQTFTLYETFFLSKASIFNGKTKITN